MQHLLCAVLSVAVAVAGAPAWPSTIPYWPKYPTRTVQVLDGTWDTGFYENIDLDTVDPSTIHFNSTAVVPSVFDNAMPGTLGRVGTMFYRARFSTKGSGRLCFTACAHYCKVWLDGKVLGDHKSGGYSMFWLPFEGAGEHVLVVAADNRDDPKHSVVYTGGDFYHFSGIHRSVIVHEHPDDTVKLHTVHVTPVEIETGTVDIAVTLVDPVPKEVCLQIILNGIRLPGSDPCPSFANRTAVLKGLRIPGRFKTWSPDSPSLTEVVVAAGKDAIHTRFGMRVLGKHKVHCGELSLSPRCEYGVTFGCETGDVWVDKGCSGTFQCAGQFVKNCTSDGSRETCLCAPLRNYTRLTLNGVVTKLKGFNRHTMWPDTGLAVTFAQHKADMALLKEAGANYVRGAHYPQDPVWLDMCDENGMLMWEETLGPGVSTSDIQNPEFMGQQVQQLEEMVSASFNHPSVIAWGFFNEGPSDEDVACEKGYYVCADKLRSLDSSRFVTWADNRVERSKCLSGADLISFNNYPGWYSHPGDLGYIATYWQSVMMWASSKFPDTPFQISETGAGGVYEWAHNASNVRWGQAYQAAVVEQDVKLALSLDIISALTLWQFCDIKANYTDNKNCAACKYIPGSVPPVCGYIDVNCRRPGGENHKGSVDFWRRPKAAYNTTKALFTK